MGSWSKLMLQLQRHGPSESWRVFTYNLSSYLKEHEHHCLLSESLLGPLRQSRYCTSSILSTEGSPAARGDAYGTPLLIAIRTSQ